MNHEIEISGNTNNEMEGYSILHAEEDGEVTGAFILRPGMELTISINPDNSVEYRMGKVQNQNKEAEEVEDVIYRHSSGLEFQSDAGIVRMPGKELVRLSPTEATILELMMRNKNRLVSHHEFADSLEWGSGLDLTIGQISDSLKVYIRRIREKIGSEKSIIETVTRRGYMVVDDFDNDN